MQTRFVALAVALAAAVVTSGCGLTGSPPSEPPAQSGHVTIGGQTRDTQCVNCTQNVWKLAIEANAEPGRAGAFLRIAIVRTVNIENINDVYGVAGSGMGEVEATTDGNTYTNTGTAVGSRPGERGTDADTAFRDKKHRVEPLRRRRVRVPPDRAAEVMTRRALRSQMRRGQSAIASLVAVTTAGAVLVHCTAAPPAPAPTSSPASNSPPPATPLRPPPPPSPSTIAAPAPARVQPVTAAELGESWRSGCPLEPVRLRRVEIDHIGLDGQTRRGELIVHEHLVAEVIEIFEQLRHLRYPIEKMRTVDHYPRADDELSMQDNNTSAFNCRDIPGTGRWSLHAYGRAVDVNPLLNPYIDRAGAYQPQNAGPYLDRNRTDPGLLHDGDPAVQIFTDHGWRWGGDWRTPKDYQHFERRNQ